MEARDLIRLLSGDNPKLQLYALKEWENSHRHDPEPLLTALDVSETEVVHRALTLATRYHPTACAAKVIRLTEAADARFRRMAVEHLAPAMGQPAQQALTSLLAKERDPFVLASAVTTAARLRLAASLLKPFLTHQEIRLRSNTIRALGALGSPEIRPLVEPALKDPALRVQGEALIALAPLISPADLLAHIRRRLESPDSMVRAATIIITAQLPLTQRLVLILERLQDPELRVVHCALRALAQLQDPTAIQHLIECYFSIDHPDTRKLLLQSLATMPSRLTLAQFVQIAPAAQVDSTRLSRILTLIGRLPDWEPFLPWLLNALERSDDGLRLQGLELV
ncbi:MAG TPA: HEAT repeat domain-containing protein, partial [Candidatus Ozemobacteraceae bacterium]|nr:HEAT repeat domain-containing protein [Candidatus Ozemobacteraceae bacterium]